MRKFWLILVTMCMCISGVDAAVRTQQNQKRQNATVINQSKQNVAQKNTIKNRSSTQRPTSKNNVNSNATKRTASRTPVSRAITGRATNISPRATATKKVMARATTTTQTFSDKYYSCRDAYFTCMDQFCAQQNDTYRRCVCSSRLKDIQTQEKTISQTVENLKDFQDINIDAISKTSEEVKSMSNASAGEKAMKKDKSVSASTLDNISDVLAASKKESLSTNGKIDIYDDMQTVWSTTDLIGGSDIANLTGDALYNAVHAQCSELVSNQCNASDLKMVTSAYGIYIDNDCEVLATKLRSQKAETNSAIRVTRQNMQDARLENYNAHNSLSLNDCIANVRTNITADEVCGSKYVHCLDITGKYLNLKTGKAIYSPDFYQLENQISLSGDILKNNKNTKFISALNAKRSFVEQTLDLCTDDADYVWEEFLRQALVEIYQGQQQRVQDVKEECLQVVNECYLSKSEDLKSFSSSVSKISLGQTLELSEDMCKEKLDTCSNLYGGGPEGLELLVNTMSNITEKTIAQTCPVLLQQYVQELCYVPSSDPVHDFPYGCRVYAPGEARYATIEICNKSLINMISSYNALITNYEETSQYMCKRKYKQYTSCNSGYYLKTACEIDSNNRNFCLSTCTKCPKGAVCPGGTADPSAPQEVNTIINACGTDYVGSLYQQLVRYALQNCLRPSVNTYVLPESILADVDNVMRSVQQQLTASLSEECSRQNGEWINIPWTDVNSDGLHDITSDTLLQNFYTYTGANTLWGYCRNQQ